MSNFNKCEKDLPDLEIFLDAIAQASANIGAVAMCPFFATQESSAPDDQILVIAGGAYV